MNGLEWNSGWKGKLTVPLMALFLGLMGLLVFWQTPSFDFVYHDDHIYVTDNLHVLSGLTRAGLAWAFTTFEAGFWHPLTWISLMGDARLYGLYAGGYHGTNVLLHTINTLLLFWALRRMTGAAWRSGLTAALFAVHPLHVEPVAWVAARKDLLSTLFWMLTLLSYIWYAERRVWSRYGLVLLCFTAGLMSKPMVVTLPFVLLLCDYWPLKRLEPADSLPGRFVKCPLKDLILEKAPLFILGLLSIGLTFYAEMGVGALKSWEQYPVPVRMLNAVVAYGNYMLKAILPLNLSVFYPHPGLWPSWNVVAAAAALAMTTAVVFRYGKRYPYLTVGWLWFLGTLVPVIGLIQIGAHAYADRYTYVPLIGLFIMAAWSLGDQAEKSQTHRTVASLLAMAVLGLFVGLSVHQVQVWRNAETLFRHAITVTRGNYMAHNNLGAALARGGKPAEAVIHYRRALEIRPDYLEATFNLAAALADQDRFAEAMVYYRRVLQMKPDLAEVHNNLGIALAHVGRTDEAVKSFETALKIRPDYREARTNLDLTLRRQRQKTVAP